MMNSGTSAFLNASRWVAAFFVVFGHVYNISVNYHDVHPNLSQRAVHFLGGFGHISVIVFFVISGFLVGGRTVLSLKIQKFNITDYFINRFSRIYTVLIPALIVGFILDRVGIAFFNASGIYTHPDEFYTNTFGNDIAKHLSFDTFVGNLMQLQTIVVSSLGSNGPLWSLANEWWYYVLFGFLMVACRPGPMLLRFAMGGAILGMVIVLPLAISLWFVVWGIGVGAAVLDRYWSGWRFYICATVAIVCFLLVRWADARLINVDAATDFAADFAMDLVVALGYSTVLVCAKNLKKSRTVDAHRALASFSYTVYLVHFPAMVFAAAFMKDVLDIGFDQQPTAAAMPYAVALLMLLYGYAWIFAAFTEVHTNAVRSRLTLVILNLLYRASFIVRKQVAE
jgi:peptidoglycan/LPS O-acetylase OafA/YrhL